MVVRFTDKVSGSKWTGTGANPAGVIMANGKIVYDGIKNENEKTEAVAFTKSGKLISWSL